MTKNKPASASMPEGASTYKGASAPEGGCTHADLYSDCTRARTHDCACDPDHAPDPWPSDALDRDVFIERVCDAGAKHYRDLPWRFIDDAYAILVSEVMLQQTQVGRVVRFWQAFLDVFPTLDALAAASVSDVLEHWQGLGYNRRALALKSTAEICSSAWGGELPHAYNDLVALPGIGAATAAGVRAFAWDEPGAYLETNVRAVFIHELFPDCDSVSDRELLPYVASSCPGWAEGASAEDVASGARGLSGTKGASAVSDASGCDPHASPRAWYYALLDWGAHIKATEANPSRRSSHYARQSAFTGSRRQKRSWIVRRVLAEEAPIELCVLLADLNCAEQAAGRMPLTDDLFSSIIDDLCGEGFLRREDSSVAIK